MSRFIEGQDRRQGALLPEHLEDYVSEENPVRVIDVWIWRRWASSGCRPHPPGDLATVQSRC
jgi:hypothetical protein